jgi:hypothetical protein
MKLKFVLLVVIERSRLENFFLRERIPFTESRERTDFGKLSDPGMNRIVRDYGARTAGDVSLRFI